MNPYQPSSPPPEKFLCEKCRAAEKTNREPNPIVRAVVILVGLYVLVWTFGTVLRLGGIHWVFVNERTGEVSEWDSFPWKAREKK